MGICIYLNLQDDDLGKSVAAVYLLRIGMERGDNCQIRKCICPNCKNVFVQIVKVICPNFKNVFVKIR